MQQFYKIFTARFAFYMVLQFFLCLGERAEAWERRQMPGGGGAGAPRPVPDASLRPTHLELSVRPCSPPFSPIPAPMTNLLFSL